jgi:two-component system sensor histidine kinase RegB
LHPDHPPSYLPTLRWLLKLRWVAVIGQITAILLAVLIYRAPIDIAGLLAAVVVTASSNALAYLLRNRIAPHARRAIFTLLALDSIMLTAMLLLSGGLHNPFSSFYLLHITLATVSLDRFAGALQAVLCFLCILLIYFFPYADPHTMHWITMEMHFQGMIVTLAATGTCIVLFVGRLQHDLREQERLVQEHELKLGRQQRIVGLATLAAGVAHELATPLSTIAVASHELRVTAGQHCHNQSCLSDSTLIRQEVDRCRTIIDRLTRHGSGSQRRTITFDRSSLAAALACHLPPACAARLSIECAHPVSVEADELAFLQSLAALVKNGCEADNTGSNVNLILTAEAGRLVVRVVDQGIGIPEEIQRQIGEPFVTTKAPGHGMGLGLYLVHTFCFLHEGAIRFANPDGRRGTVVTLDLPLRTT